MNGKCWIYSDLNFLGIHRLHCKNTARWLIYFSSPPPTSSFQSRAALTFLDGFLGSPSTLPHSHLPTSFPCHRFKLLKPTISSALIHESIAHHLNLHKMKNISKAQPSPQSFTSSPKLRSSPGANRGFSVCTRR